MLVAATTIEHQLVLKTRNLHNFMGCGVQVINPFDGVQHAIVTPGTVFRDDAARKLHRLGPSTHFPGIEKVYPRRLKVSDVAGHQGHSMHKGRGCDQCVSFAALVRHMQARATLGNGCIHR